MYLSILSCGMGPCTYECVIRGSHPWFSVLSKQWKLEPTANPSSTSLMWKGLQIDLPASWWSVCVCLGVITTAAFYIVGLSVCLSVFLF